MIWPWYLVGGLLLLTLFDCLFILPGEPLFKRKDKTNRGDKANAKGKKHGKNQDAFDPVNSWHGYRKD